MDKIVITKEIIKKMSPKNIFQLSFHQMKYLGLENKKGFRKKIIGVELNPNEVEFLFRLKYMSKKKLKKIEINPITLPAPIFVDDKKRSKKLTKKDHKKRKREYNDYLKSDIWREKRNAVLLRDDFKCQKCFAKDDLHVHHKTYKNFKNELLSELITLCSICHKKVHSKK